MFSSTFDRFWFRTGKNYYSEVFLEECKYVVKKKMPDHITNDIELSSDDSISKACDEENSGEENSNKKTLMKKILMNKIRNRKFFLEKYKKFFRFEARDFPFPKYMICFLGFASSLLKYETTSFRKIYKSFLSLGLQSSISRNIRKTFFGKNIRAF